jgi:predicted O-linked N-acetylglucosamine transferase (SPINDLY family)
LKEEEKIREGTPVKGYRWRLFPTFAAAVLFLMIISIGLYFLLSQKTGETRLLAEKALLKVEKKESAYLQAIVELEERVLPKMASLNLELMLLYRDRLETIDDQIIRCKEALGENPANAHIRRYLLAALQDKRETLSEILELANES